ncbi:hypothetical protein F442_06902 [Phytophthora nicotianae P10297]|uniref:Uncharacterized protein n=1 Tax=Phytophthora nicotianae P10297 TaxID=1317064 RepID=W2ZIQ4_PHYNI|nr:hypothetical protein F442_06902 [Phytophthora nicotianae P10297]
MEELSLTGSRYTPQLRGVCTTNFASLVAGKDPARIRLLRFWNPSLGHIFRNRESTSRRLDGDQCTVRQHTGHRWDLWLGRGDQESRKAVELWKVKTNDNSSDVITKPFINDRFEMLSK